MRRKTKEQFIEESSHIYGNKYEYSLLNYVNSKTKVKIICPIHGIFEILPSNFLNGHGCKKCSIEKEARKKSLTTEQYIEKAKKVNNFYIFKNVKYKNATTKIEIICPKHGLFKMLPYNFLQGQICPECANENRANKQKCTTEKFIEKVKKIRPEYDYSLVNYVNNHTKIKVICPKHGLFEIVPAQLLKGVRCKFCWFEKDSQIKFLTTEEFIKRAKLIHGNKYDYSLTNYKNAKTKVKIICPVHGIFEQKPNSHLNGNGCYICNISKGENQIRQFLKEKNIFFEEQKRFNNCRYKYPLPFDFYIPEKNILIEYDGEQHFKSIEYFGGKEKFITQKERDKIKDNYCKENNIKLIRISYKDDIKEKLNEI